MHKKTLLALLLSLLSTGCYSAASTIANAPTHTENLSQEKDVAYGAQPQQKLDIYQSLVDKKTAVAPVRTCAKSRQPASENGWFSRNGAQCTSSYMSTVSQKNAICSKGSRDCGQVLRPVIVFFYGGSWSTGDKNMYRFVAADLAKAGYLVVIPNYIKYPDAKFPAFMDDIALATAWTYKNIAAHGGDPERLYLMGHSAGAHVAALLISDTSYLKKYDATPQIIKAFVGLSGPYAFTPDTSKLKAIFAPPSNYPAMQVPTFITGNEPPMLLLYGGDDSAVALFNLTKLADAITAKGGIVETKVWWC
jgi:acetyl esterase/lipase